MSDNKYIETEEKFMNSSDQDFQRQEGWNKACLDYSQDVYKTPIGKNIFYTEGYECGWEFCAASEAIK